jgi:hypothetical protein
MTVLDNLMLGRHCTCGWRRGAARSTGDARAASRSWRASGWSRS